MRASRSRRVSAPTRAIWEIVSAIEALPLWYSGVQSAEHVKGPGQGVGRRHRMERMLYSHDLQVEQEVVEWQSESRITLLDVGSTIDGAETSGGVQKFRTTVDLQPIGDGGTLVTVEYQWTARFGVPWLQSFLLGGRVMGREIREMLANIDRIATERE